MTTLAASTLFDPSVFWTDFDDIPTGSTFYTRRGFPYLKTGDTSAEPQFDEGVLDRDEYYGNDVFGDWPYFTAASIAENPASAIVPGDEDDELRARVGSFLDERPQFVAAMEHCSKSRTSDYYRWAGHAEARRTLAVRLADALHTTSSGNANSASPSSTAHGDNTIPCVWYLPGTSADARLVGRPCIAIERSATSVTAFTRDGWVDLPTSALPDDAVVVAGQQMSRPSL